MARKKRKVPEKVKNARSNGKGSRRNTKEKVMTRQYPTWMYHAYLPATIVRTRDTALALELEGYGYTPDCEIRDPKTMLQKKLSDLRRQITELEDKLRLIDGKFDGASDN